MEKARNSAESTFSEIDLYETTLNAREAGILEIEKPLSRLQKAPVDPEVTGLLSLAKASLQSAQSNQLYSDSIYLEQLAVAD